MQARPEREQAVKTAEKELARAERSLDGAKKRGAPDCDVENLEKKVAYKRLVLEWPKKRKRPMRSGTG